MFMFYVFLLAVESDICFLYHKFTGLEKYWTMKIDCMIRINQPQGINKIDQPDDL
jgi:hypothetical protein